MGVLGDWMSQASERLQRQLRYAHDIPEAEIERHLRRRLPWRWQSPLGPWVVDDPLLRILPDGTLTLRLKFGWGRRAQAPQGELVIQGGLHYRPGPGDFVVEDARLIHFRIGRRPCQPLRLLVEQALRHWFRHHPVFQLDDERRGQGWLKRWLHRVEARAGHLRLHLRARP